MLKLILNDLKPYLLFSIWETKKRQDRQEKDKRETRETIETRERQK